MNTTFRYSANMLGLATDDPYGAIVLTPIAQAIYLRFCEHDELSSQLMDGLLTCDESARLADNVELDEDLARIVLRPEFSAYLMEVSA